MTHHICAYDPDPAAWARRRARVSVVRARLENAPNGVIQAQKHGASGAGILSSLVGADGLVELPEDMTELTAGSPVDFLPFNEVLG